MFKLPPFLLFAVSLSAFAVQTDSAEEQMNAIFQTIHDGNEQFLKHANLVHDRESAEALALAFQKTEENSLRNSLKIEQWSKEQPQEFASVSAKWKKRFEEQKMDMAAVFRSIARQNWYGSKTLENHCQSLANSVNLIDPVPIGEFLGTYYLNPRPERIGWFLNLLPDLLDTQRLPGEQNPFAFFCAAVFKSNPERLPEWMEIIKRMPHSSQAMMMEVMCSCAGTMPEARKLAEDFIVTCPEYRPLLEKAPSFNPSGINAQTDLQLYCCLLYYTGSGDPAALKPIFQCAVFPVLPGSDNTITAHANASLSQLFPADPALKQAAGKYLAGCTREERLSFARFHTEEVQREILGEVLHASK